MLWACIINFGGSLDTYLPIIDFSYKNIDHTSIGMPLMRCCMEESIECYLLGRSGTTSNMKKKKCLEYHGEYTKNKRKILYDIKSSEKSYVDNRLSDLKLEVRDFVL